MRPNTTRPAPPLARRNGRRPRRRHRLDQQRDLPRLYAGRALRLAAEDPAHQLLLVRLRLLHHRRSSNVPRARFSVDEVVNLTLGFYKRNYIEGLFLSSGIIRSPDYTMEQMMLVAKSLRRAHGFAGYIHLKTIPEASPWLIEQAGLWADRLSINIEIPSRQGLKQLAPEECADHHPCHGPDARAHRRSQRGTAPLLARGPEHPDDRRRRCDQRRAGAGDQRRLYNTYALRRVYYSAFSPIPAASAILPLKPPPLQRENRLYQADWLLLLRLQRGGDRQRRRSRHAGSRNRSEARLGPEESRPLSARREHRRSRAAVARAGSRRPRGPIASSRCGGTRSSGCAISRGSPPASAGCTPS